MWIETLANETTSFVTVGIARNPKICGGRPTIVGTRIAISDIVELHHSLGWDVGRIVFEYPQLCVAEVVAALEYYERNREEIDKYLREEKSQENNSLPNWRR